MRKGPLPFHPSARQMLALDALVGAAAFTFAMLVRFIDEGVPQTYVMRTILWAPVAAVIHLLAAEGADWLRRPRSPLARRPVLPFIVAVLAEYLVLLVVNDVLIPVAWRLPHFVVAVGPLLAMAGSAALRLAAQQPELSADALLPRRVVPLDVAACAPTIRGKRVLITGAAGSIGAELARQVLTVGPAALTVLDTNETGLYELEADLSARKSPDVAFHSCMGDVTDAQRIERLFEQERPEVVFHAAAYKHVPLVEANPEQGFSSNVIGTRTICEAAVAVGAQRVVVISTDKAVNPTSFMGLTKRAAELIVAAVGQKDGNTTVLSAVRFGNVLGSRGSVVPTLVRQIDAGGPVTITHPDAQRFFMTIAEAASLVLLSAAFGRPASVFVLEMGEELRIADLADRLVRMKGLRPGRDVTFEYIGLRPGEKLREELAGEGETLVATDHPFVRRVESSVRIDAERFLTELGDLDARRRAGLVSSTELPTALRELIDNAVRPNELAHAS